MTITISEKTLFSWLY